MSRAIAVSTKLYHGAAWASGYEIVAGSGAMIGGRRWYRILNLIMQLDEVVTRAHPAAALLQRGLSCWK